MCGERGYTNPDDPSTQLSLFSLPEGRPPTVHMDHQGSAGVEEQEGTPEKEDEPEEPPQDPENKPKAKKKKSKKKKKKGTLRFLCARASEPQAPPFILII